jgi:hypothetical protein
MKCETVTTRSRNLQRRDRGERRRNDSRNQSLARTQEATKQNSDGESTRFGVLRESHILTTTLTSDEPAAQMFYCNLLDVSSP